MNPEQAPTAPESITIENGLQRTVISSAPALDAITQTQIALNNLLDQVRETFLFLLEGAPPLDCSSGFVHPPEDSIKRWQKFRLEFEEEWRSGKPRRKKQTADETITLEQPTTSTAQAGPAPPVSQPSADLDDEDDTAEILPTSYAPPPITEEALQSVKADALFRAQRIAAITQSIRQMVGKLPSTKIEVNGQLRDIGDPHRSESIGAQVTHWKNLNSAIESSFHLHSQALHMWMKSLHRGTRKVSKNIMKPKPQ
eukprot:Protomagalhaensia_wolfi_Nauph_80__5475@NODE_59_length_4115_cov_62_940628_g49_i0_p3_GENE_NODE_59_length_4115_cov_62_940628_g49_i0NODE_59_length_4115_cov_62_940628_g49_i0_p3_ORF_typecomplete_len255_score44_65Med21/PF11221_8/0_00058Retrotrans_gag/PF03732_17/0_62Retrotrans_gag/PF03732_17/1e02_NODE_59_length_4115_cov_62_940628_g49_i024903254